MHKYLAILGASLIVLAAAPTPAEHKIAQAKESIRKNPKAAEGYNDLALALVRRARESASTAALSEAEEALKQALALDPRSFEARKAGVMVLLARHEFSQALDEARALNRQVPDDNTMYGLMADAEIALGRYAEAEKSVQWMIDMRPVNPPGFQRGATLRELFGDFEGALDWLNSAYRLTSPNETEEQAWLLVRIARLEMCQGKAEQAEKHVSRSLSLFPDYPHALAAFAGIRSSQQRFEEAATLLERRLKISPSVALLFERAKALDMAGQNERARGLYAEFERLAAADVSRGDNSNRELVLYYVDHARRPEEALRIASLEMARRQDVYTLDAYAWALAAAGRDKEARAQMDKALSVGVRDPGILRHSDNLTSARTDRAALAH
jgi:tetratricopeptide (TPR) repeat protein